RSPKAVLARVLQRPDGRKAGTEFSEHAPCVVGAAVIHDQDFVRDAVEPQLEVQVLDGGCNATRLVTCRYDDRQQGGRYTRPRLRALHGSLTSSQSGCCPECPTHGGTAASAGI